MAIVIKDKFCIYSLVDHDEIIEHKWHLNKGGYAASEKGIFMHRMIMECSDDMVVDHINGNKLDNRRENLRIVHRSANTQNMQKRVGTKSQYVGVYLARRGRYKASINVNKQRICLGGYSTAEAAAEARDMYIVHKIPDSLFLLNFPDKKEEYLQRPYEQVLRTNRKPEKKIIDKTAYESTDCDEIIRIIIPSNLDAYVTIDTEDYEEIRHMQFFIDKDEYVKSAVGGKLHRLIMAEKDPNVYIDHIDGNKLNNTKANLRKSNAKLNGQNKSKRANTSSKYLGVVKRTLLSGEIKWHAKMKIGEKYINMGSFDLEEDAAKARDQYLLDNFPSSHYKINFPESANTNE